MQTKNYDYIFLGAGCASLSIAMRMIESNQFNQKKILLIDKGPKTKNDRTWCFWEQEPGFFEDLVYHKWNELLFKENANNIINLEMGNYEYKMIRGIEFYNKCFSLINLQKNIDIIYGAVSLRERANNSIQIKIDDEPLEPGKDTIVFSSIPLIAGRQKGKFYLLQHFKGWIIEITDNFFNPKQGTLMDFSVPQIHGTTFAYVLPLSPKKALVEYTIFSEKLLSNDEYDKELKSYLNNFLGSGNYTVAEEEFGVIPMTNANFPAYKSGIFFIGTAGGETKPSTGYTFRFIQKQADEIVKQLVSKGRPLKNKKIKKRFLFYDSTLLHILSKKLLEGKTIFSILFRKDIAANIFKFLDNESTLKEEIKLLNTLPKKIFIRAGFKEFIKMIFTKNRS